MYLPALALLYFFLVSSALTSVYNCVLCSAEKDIGSLKWAAIRMRTDIFKILALSPTAHKAPHLLLKVITLHLGNIFSKRDHSPSICLQNKGKQLSGLVLLFEPPQLVNCQWFPIVKSSHDQFLPNIAAASSFPPFIIDSHYFLSLPTAFWHLFWSKDWT